LYNPSLMIIKEFAIFVKHYVKERINFNIILLNYAFLGKTHSPVAAL
jgi:hypothetical protein